MNALLNITNIEQNLVRLLSGMLLATGVLYGMFVLSTVFNTVDRQNYERSIQKTSSTLGQLESSYMAQAKSIDLTFARAFGFVDVSGVKFVKKNAGLGLTASSRNDI